ncbi:hypothetical protein SAMN05421740_10492 [Parapedobacter koreensis]|uniref:Uncharacterized protein n=1 Tax=Parapedobacter koreensis TaxID=332977 RepID=A0A1H7NTA6_9SPHI|nr:hypothetical protein SAMN05421740_10492 [Parapedobacter koreensis]
MSDIGHLFVQYRTVGPGCRICCSIGLLFWSLVYYFSVLLRIGVILLRIN